jgi:ribonuclease P protein component
MKKQFIVKNNYQFEDIIKTGKYIKNKYYIIYNKDNNLKYDRFGISLSKKFGNAVFRNKYKRKLRSIIDNYRKYYVNQKDYIIILRKEAINKPYELLEKEFIALMTNQKKGAPNDKKNK